MSMAALVCCVVTRPRARSTYRQVQAEMTRERIVVAARQLMTERGWAGATIDSIADLAGVATPTVYAAFGNKLGIVEAMRISMLRESKIPELMQQMEGELDPVRRLALWAS